jgi:hypothetical protein
LALSPPGISENVAGADTKLLVTMSDGGATLIATASRKDPPPVYEASFTSNVIWNVSVVAVIDIGDPLYVSV